VIGKLVQPEMPLSLHLCDQTNMNNNNDSNDTGILFSNVNGHEYLPGNTGFYPMKKSATKIKFPWCDLTGKILLTTCISILKLFEPPRQALKPQTA